MSNNRNLRVFLSYAHEDNDQVDVLYRQLTAFGFDPWIDNKELLPGQNWEEIIERELRKTDAVIVCLSDVSNIKTGYFHREVKISLKVSDNHPSQDVFLIPVKLNQCDVPFSLWNFQYIELYTPDGFEKLIKALNMRAQQIGINESKYAKFSDLSADLLIKMVSTSSSDASANVFKKMCKHIHDGKLSYDVLFNFKAHPYWLIRKLAIQEIINSGLPNTLDYLFEFRHVKYHISQDLIRGYIKDRLEAASLNVTDFEKAVSILEYMSSIKGVSETTISKNQRMLDKLISAFKI